MAGGSLPHADIALNVASLLRAQLQGRCKVRNSDAKVGITEDGPFVYPDMSVSCDERDRTTQKFSRYLCLIVEVVSPGTEAYDRGGKFTLYRRLDSLKEYVLVGVEAKTGGVFRRNSDGSWAFIPYGLGETIELASLGIMVTMEAIYKDVVLEQDNSETGF